MPKEIDKSIIEGLVRYKRIDFNDLGYINCIRHNSDMKDFGNRQEYDKAIKEDDEFLLTLLIAYSFERQGFDSRLPQCTMGCVFYSDPRNKTKTHPVSVLIALKEIEEEYGTHEITKLIQREGIENLAKKWFVRTIEHHKKSKRGFNEKDFNTKHLESFLQFFEDSGISELRNTISNNQLNAAYDLLIKGIEGSKKIKGIGPKVAKLIIRDLVFSLTNWGKDEELDSPILEDATVLSYAIPIDLWVRRISLSIPIIGNKVKDSLTISDLAEGNLIDRIDEKLSFAIAELCYTMKLNPMRFDYGAYLFGFNEIKRKIPLEGIYDKLQKNFVKANSTLN